MSARCHAVIAFHSTLHQRHAPPFEFFRSERVREVLHGSDDVLHSCAFQLGRDARSGITTMLAEGFGQTEESLLK